MKPTTINGSNTKIILIINMMMATRATIITIAP
jgi:hypothetical protein